jgi:hypothetical protein
MRNALSVVSATPRPVAPALARATALTLLTLLIVSCHSETTAPAIPKALEFSVQPLNTDAVTRLAPIRVTALDGSGHVLTSFLGPIAITLSTNPGNATLSGTKSVNATAGVAVFSDLTVNRPGTGYILSVSSSGVTQTSAAFNIVPGPVSNLVFSVQPNNATAGATIAPAIQVQAMDAAGNLVTPFNGNVTMTIGTNPAGGTLSGTATIAAAAGVAIFNSLSIDKAGTGYKLTATAAAGSGQSSAFNITAGTATQLVFTTQPLATAAGSNISPAVVITAQDQFGNNATSFANAITIAITGGTGKAGAALSGTKTVTAVNGAATFSTLSIDSVGTGYTLSATAAGLVGGFASATFNIVPGVATQLVFTGQPTNATAGANIAPAIVVTAHDAKGNTATGFTGSVTLAFGTNAGGGTLRGTVAANAVAGVASFSTVNINKTGTGYTLAAASGALSGATSSAFNIVAGAATQLVFTSQPTNTLSAATINSSGGVQVAAQDSLGNIDLTFTANVTVAFANNAGGGTLNGPTTVPAASGVAKFTTLSIAKVGTGYTLAATATGLTAATSTGFNIINSVATQLVFTVQPALSTVAGVTMSTVTVTALDAQSNTAVDFTAAIAVAIGTNPGSDTLRGTKSVAAVAGVATFSTLSIGKVGDGYTLLASAGSLTPATSGNFKITPAAATHLVFSQQPTSAIAGVSVAPAVVVSALDTFGNVDTAYKANVDIGIGTNPGTGTLFGTTPQTATNGVATFSDLNIKQAGTGYTLHATSGSVTDAVSSPFNIGPAALSQLIFTSEPVATQAGSAISPAVQVTGEDAFGNTVTTFNGNVTVAIGTNGGTPTAGTLGGTLTQPAVNGVATFPDLTIDRSGSGYTLTATATGPTPATSAAFGITAGAASKLAFNVPPANAAAGASIAAPIVVLVEDAKGNTVSSASDNVTITIANNAGSPIAGTLSGANLVAAVNGVATFSNLSIDKVGAGYTLLASSGILTSATSSPFNITPAAATHLVFSGPPTTTASAATINAVGGVKVSAEDAFGNTDTTFTNSVTVGIGTNGGTPTPGNLSGALTVANATAGVASFSNLSIDRSGTGYTLTASTPAAGVSTATSGTFDITAGTVTQLVFTVQPTNAQAGLVIAPNVVVKALDAQGNVNPTFDGAGNNVTLAIVAGPSGANLTGATVAPAQGIATFNGLFVDKVGTGYTLQASTGTGPGKITSGSSSSFNITPGAASQLVFVQQPAESVVVGANLFPAIKVAAQDAFGNTVTTFANNISLSLPTNPGSATLTGSTRAAVSGIATFSTLTVSAAGVGYQLGAASGGLTSLPSTAFKVIGSGATALFFKVQPSSATAGNAISPSMTVEARNPSGLVDTNYTNAITLSITPNTGASKTIDPGSTVTRNAVKGVATFPGIVIDTAANNYKLTAAATGLTSAISGFFAINPGPVDHFAYLVEPSNATATATIAPAVEVSALDAFNNVVTSFADSVKLRIHDANASGGVLSGDTAHKAVNGVAIFSTLSIDKAQTAHTLDAIDFFGGSGLSNLTSSSFDITVSASNHLVFATPPTTTTTDLAIPTFSVQALDGGGNLNSGFIGNVTVSIVSNTGTGGATLSGNTTVTASGGVAQFSGLKIDKKGVNYRLSATTSGYAGATSAQFNITAGVAAQLAFVQDPTNANAGAAINPAVTVVVQDAHGNQVTGFGGLVTMSIAVNQAGGTLSGTTDQPFVNDTARFSDLSIDAAGDGYRLQASSGSLTPDVSQAFQITGGVATHLVFTVSATDAVAGVNISPSVKVTGFDGLGNVDKNFSGSVTVTLTPNTGTSGAVLSASVPQTAIASSGVATFSGLNVDKVGTGYTLTATTTTLGVTGTTSGTFAITPAAATHLVFTVQPSNTAANALISPPVEVTAEDNFGNVDTAYHNINVTVAMGTNAGGAGTVFTGTKTVVTVHGVATFGDLSINNVGTGYTLTAQSGAFALAGSNAFNITP